MLIDWFTVAAQAVNFLLLVWLLKRFLYTPIRKAMREREQRIQSDLDQAQEARQDAQEQQQQLRRQREELDDERRQVLEQAREEVRQWKEQAMDQARRDVETQRAAWNEALEEERRTFARRLTSRIADASLVVCRKALADLADTGLEARLAGRMLELLPGNGQAPPQRVLVRTGFPPGEELKERLRQGLAERWPGLQELSFEQVEGLGFGIECLLDQDKISWNADRYMSGLEERVLASFSGGHSHKQDMEQGGEELQEENAKRDDHGS